MARSDRLFDLMQILRDGQLHTAAQLAERLGVTVRTIYRDMERLQASGVPIDGARGVGYRSSDKVSLPPLALSPIELEALQLGIAIVAEAGDSELASAAASLADKLDAGLPEQSIAADEAWKTAFSPLTDTVRGVGHMATLRISIKNQQKLEVTYIEQDGSHIQCKLRPLKLDNWGRVWSLAAWNETEDRFCTLRLDLIAQARALPELFSDEPGKSLKDMLKS